MTLELKHFIEPDKRDGRYYCLVTDGVKRVNEEGVKCLTFNMEEVKKENFDKYEIINPAKAIIPVVRIKKK